MFKKPKISIIIPVKNGEKTINACLKGIFEQTLIKQTEVIIIDSGSTDNTLDIIKNYSVKLYQISPIHCGRIHSMAPQSLRWERPCVTVSLPSAAGKGQPM